MNEIMPNPEPNFLINRSNVPSGLKYGEYRQYLRRDFFHSCAYCTLTEAEAGGVRFTIDHYEPRSARQDLEHVYENLIYCCDDCNRSKGDRCPPESARADGKRFFRPDYDLRSAHFKMNGVRIEGITEVGKFSEIFLRLNRQYLIRLRDLRSRLKVCDEYVIDGINALRHIPIDRLPPHIKKRASGLISRVQNVEAKMLSDMEEILRSAASSHLLDHDETAVELSEVARKEARALEGLYPGAWTSPKRRASKE
ncbi:hypothetical protein CA608_12575 [Caulobacter vibrioides]|uniref:HNH endonuclease n=1 Tax=Caulobacter vibrioides TaxID=155892 RepID=UPI000BB4E233|nr:HNH endonuclease [Caulobacter vibrioides]ATC25308.1 hypothetical protein CA608_12575 [Caulobacter vibrioides]